MAEQKKKDRRTRIHDLLSPKIAAKRERRAQVSRERAKAIAEGKAEPNVPASVDNFRDNRPLFGPHKIRRLEAPVVPRKIAPTEGQATVNGKTGEEVKKLIHKPGPTKKTVDPAAGVIEAKPKSKPDGKSKPKRSRGRPRKSRNGSK